MFEWHNVQFAPLKAVIEQEGWTFSTFLKGSSSFTTKHEYGLVVHSEGSMKLVELALKKPAQFSSLLEGKQPKVAEWSFHYYKASSTFFVNWLICIDIDGTFRCIRLFSLHYQMKWHNLYLRFMLHLAWYVFHHNFVILP
jgi:hypothetical protein